MYRYRCFFYVRNTFSYLKQLYWLANIKRPYYRATTTYTMIIGAICLISCFFFHFKSCAFIEHSYWSLGIIPFMAFFTSVLGYLWWNQGIKGIGAGKTSLFFNIVPVVTMIISFVIGMPITVFQIIGALLVISGVLVASGLISNPKVNHK